MAVRTRGSIPALGLVAVAALLAGCSSASNTGNLNVVGQAQAQPQQLQPVQNSSVAQNQLPPLGGVTSAPAPGLSGQPVLGGQAQASASMTPSLSGTPGAPMQTASAGSGSFVSTAPMASGASAGAEGVWTVMAGATQCRLNLPLTTKEGTTRYRASAPGCTLPGLSTVGSWQQVGTQIQLYDEGNTMIAALAQSSGRYIGTLSGGQAISLQR